MIVHTAAGAVRGTTTAEGHAWLGVPYAAPPVGPLRFAPPQPVTPWPGIRDATEHGTDCVQLYAPGLGSEDCLYLNIWTPAARASGAGADNTAAAPVLVWVHGGAFFMGGGSEYDGGPLAARTGAVVVTVNYRLGPWGFLHLPGEAANPALRDIVAALSWVRHNVAAFGGDPGTVTLCGHSAGAMLVGTLLGVPAATGLFHRAVLLSGAASLVRTPAEAAEVTRRLHAATGAAALRGLSTEELRISGERVRIGAADDILGNHAFLPVIDGRFLPEHPLGAVAGGAARHLPLVVGWCRAEPPALFGGPAVRLAEAQAGAGGPVWLMRFDHTPQVSPFGRLGPAHGADMTCLWSRIPVFGPVPNVSSAPMGPADRAVTATLQDLVRKFAHTGRPGHAGLPPWPGYRRPDRPTLLLDANPRIAYGVEP